MPKRNIVGKFVNSRLLKSYGSWLYCNNCNKTVAYICYTTYSRMEISFVCKCGNHGKVELAELGNEVAHIGENPKSAILVENRFCCPNDNDPLFSAVTKQLERYEYQITCLKCNETFSGNG